MDNCIFKINIDGHFEVFKTEDELHNFLRENRKGLISSLLTDKTVFSKSLNKQESTLSGINSMSDTVDFVEDGHTLTVNGGPHQGMELTPVTKFIYDSKGEDGNRMVRGFSLKEWEPNERASLQKEVKDDGSPRYDNQQCHFTR